MKSKLQDIQDFAKTLDQELYREFGSERVCKLINGGNLFLGEHYVKSDEIFMTFNQGKSKKDPEKFHVEVSPVDRYWDNPEAQCRGRYLGGLELDLSAMVREGLGC